MTMSTAARHILLTVVLAVASQAAIAQQAGTITDVTVYRGQALVTREVQFDAQAGPQEQIVTSLPEKIVPESLYATATDKVAIRAVRFRATAIEDEPRPEVKQLDDQLEEFQDELNRVESELSVLEHRTSYLDKLEEFAGAKSREGLSRGNLNPQSLQETTTFIFEQRSEVAEKKLELDKTQKTTQEQISVLERRRNALMGGADRTLREAVVFLDAAEAGPAKLTLSYLVDGVGWSPAYSASLNGEKDRLDLEYHAVVTQMSGEDWPNVQLTLSTSHPRMHAAAPLLSPLRIALVSGAEDKKADAGGAQAFKEKRRQLAQQIRDVPQQKPQGGGYGGGGGGFGGGGLGGGGLGGRPAAAGPPGQPGLQAEDEFLAANVLAARLQNMELTAPDDVVRLSKRMGDDVTEGLAVDYPIPGAISLQSRQDQQMFRIATLDLEADFYYTALPLLTDYVYQAVEAVNTSDYPLLPGPYSAYLDGAFAGRGNISLVARGQGLIMGFGTQSQLRASRVLDEKTTETRGGNKVLDYTYRLRLQNFMDQPVQVRVWDRVPQAPDDQVTVTLTDPDPPLSEDEFYQTYERPHDLLRWDVDVPARAAKADAFSFTYQFRVELDKSYAIGELPADIEDKMRTGLRTIRGYGGGFGGGGAQPK